MSSEIINVIEIIAKDYGRKQCLSTEMPSCGFPSSQTYYTITFRFSPYTFLLVLSTENKRVKIIMLKILPSNCCHLLLCFVILLD